MLDPVASPAGKVGDTGRGGSSVKLDWLAPEIDRYTRRSKVIDVEILTVRGVVDAFDLDNSVIGVGNETEPSIVNKSVYNTQ